MRIDVLGGLGAFPTAHQSCSGFLVEHDGFRLLIDPGYATLQPLLARVRAEQVDAVYVSHGHPDHCADLQPLARARVLTDRSGPPLSVYAPTGSLADLLAIDEPGLLEPGYHLTEFTPGETLRLGPYGVRTFLLLHWVPNAGARFEASGVVLAHTGDTGPSPALVELARDADVLIAEATYRADGDRRPVGSGGAGVRGYGETPYFSEREVDAARRRGPGVAERPVPARRVGPGHSSQHAPGGESGQRI
ncbi:MBL fold metallo-hydrolase [Micromonospora sp. NPDC018662]|uniref:MBL fold metallo-hydrolase n=1 Tax=Micromonospora sp. NPDC018662 TaxID=3364238 RepID=UPI0037BD0B05